MIDAACPSREALLRYLQGIVDVSQVDSLEEHLEQCPSCEETVAELEDTNDTLMRHLPLAAVDKVEADADAPVWIERLKAGPPTNRDDQPERAIVDGQREPAANGWTDGLVSYELLEVLGQGGMGVVYRGRHRQLRRPVAVKVVRPKLVSAADAHRRFDREIQILGGLNHPGIVMATDAGRVGRAAYLVMELIDGVDLARLVRSAGPLAVGEACEVARQIAVALSAAHAAGAVHRDVKPSNVMIDSSGRVKLLDFGLACLIDLSAEHGETSLGRLIGTLDYMAPEQADGVRVQASADLYGLGATLFYLLAGRPPHAGDRNRTLLSQLKALSSDDPPHLTDLRLDMPQELSNLVAKLLARNPADRPETAAEVADRLATWADPNAKTTLVKMIPTVDRSDDVEAAARSLAELIGHVPEVATSEPTDDLQPASIGGGRRIGRWLMGLAGFAAAALAIVLLVETPEGTLRIESDAQNVQVELVDEAGAAKTVEIEEGENATRLRAGKYQIRLAGKHDNLLLTPGSIELRRGEERLARITQLPAVASGNRYAGGGGDSNPGGGSGGDASKNRYAFVGADSGGSGRDGSELGAVNDELTRVTIPVVYEDGHPAIGAEVTMTMQGNSDRPVIATGKVDSRGAPYKRNLPYGKYEMTIKVPDGRSGAYWSVTQFILLEFGGSYEQKLVAPTPETRAKVTIQNAFNPASLKGLQFGGFTSRQVLGGIVWSPEPGKQDDSFTNFPVLGNGISDVALHIQLRVTRGVKQPSGKTIVWYWFQRDDMSDSLFLIDRRVTGAERLGWKGDVVFDLPESGYFTKLPKTQGIQYFLFHDYTGTRVSLSLPPATVDFEVKSFFGKATPEVIQALGIDLQSSDRGVWLEAKLNADSAWVPRGIDLSDWRPGNPRQNLAQKTLTLEPDESYTIRIASPDPSTLEGAGTEEAQ